MANYFQKKYIAWAYRHGRREHKFGRLQFLPNVMGMCVTTFLIYTVSFSDMVVRSGLIAILLAQLLTLICQTVYLGSHMMEKFCFKKGGGGSRG